MESLLRLAISSGFLMMSLWDTSLVIQFKKKNIFLLIFFSESKLGVNLTLVPEFHSHLESMASLTRDQLMSHISVSYLLEQGTNNNVVSLDEPFPQSIDPTRYYQMIIMQTLNVFISDFTPCFVTCSVQSFVLNIET